MSTPDPKEYVRSPVFEAPEKQPKSTSVQTLHEQSRFVEQYRRETLKVSVVSTATTEHDRRPSDNPTKTTAVLRFDRSGVSVDIPVISAEFLRDMAALLLRVEKAIGPNLPDKDWSCVDIAWAQPHVGSKTNIPTEQPPQLVAETDEIKDIEKRLNLPADSVRRWETVRKELSPEDAAKMALRAEELLGIKSNRVEDLKPIEDANSAADAKSQLSPEDTAKLASIVAEHA